MPSYLDHQPSPIFPTKLNHLDNKPYAPLPADNSFINESFDESSASSSLRNSEAASDLTPAPEPLTQANGTRPSSTNSVIIDQKHDSTMQDSDIHTAPSYYNNPHKINGAPRPPSHLPPSPPPSQPPSTDYFPQQQQQQQQPRSQTSTATGPDGATTITSNNNNRPPSTPIGSKTLSMQSNPDTFVSAHASPTSPDFQRRSQSTTRRLSNPAPYQSPGATPIPNTSTTSFSSPTLKQRHTLEVPRPGRSSRDGLDSALSTGRFSPTTVAGPSSSARRSSLSLGKKNAKSIQSDMPRDEVVPDEDALRWAEAYRQKMASKRKKKEEVDEDRVLVGTKVDEHHANWVTAYNMLTGIRVSVSRTNAKLDRPLTDADFDFKQKSTFDIAGNEMVPSAKYDFKFKDYAPWVFRHLRALFQLDPADYLMSLTGKYILSELGSPGKSGSFFYFSRDYKYIIKTIHHAEHKFLRKILKQYYKHVTENPNTLLSQFYGLHRVKIPYGKKIHFVVMNNLFPPHRDIHQTFDLKGSSIGRDYLEDKLAENPRATLKDLNWLRRKRQLELGLQKKRLFLEQLYRDVELLKELDIMDYSLLIGIHDLRKGNDENVRGKTLQVFNPGGERTSEDDPSGSLLRTPSKLESFRKAKELRQMIRQERPVPMGQLATKMPEELEKPQFQSVFNQDEGGFRATHEDNSPADEVYYLGVIDCLTHYGVIKKIEHFWKGLSNDRTQISALPPKQYGDRFYKFMEGITLSQELAEQERLEKERLELQAGAEADDATQNARTSTRQSNSSVPAMPTYQPPPPPPTRMRSPEAQAVIDRASEEARKSGQYVGEEEIPDRVRTVTSPDKRHTAQSSQLETILPVVEEATEGQSGSSNAGDDNPNSRHRNSQRGDDGAFYDASSTNLNRLSGGSTSRDVRRSSSNTDYLKPHSADSGYAGNGHVNGNIGSASLETSPKLKPRMSRESLNKSLPPLPSLGGFEKLDDGFLRTGLA